ncbi:MAG: 2-oxoacid:acceptor oxidoreductase family protein [Bacillota bacterium]
MEGLTEFRLHGRGGQGIVMAAAIFAEAVFNEGLYARAFSLFGAERRGAPVTAFIRVSEARLMPRCRVYRPDYVAVLDSSMNSTAVLAGLDQKSRLLINADRDEKAARFGEGTANERYPAYLVDATGLAMQYHLTIGSFPMVNTVMVGALARISNLATLESVCAVVEKRISTRLEDNLKAAAVGFNQVREVIAVA